MTSGWGIGALTWSGSAWGAYGVTGNGPCGGWNLDTNRNRMNVADDFDHDGRAELLVTSNWGIGLLDLSGSPKSKTTVANGSLLGGWRVDTTNNQFECGVSSMAMILFNCDWSDTVGKLTSVLRSRGTSVFQWKDPAPFINALKGFSAVAQPGDRLLVYLGVHGGPTNRAPSDTSNGPCGRHTLQATTATITLLQISPSFHAIGYRDTSWDPSGNSAKHISDLGGINVLQFTGAAGFTRLLYFAKFYFYLMSLVYLRQRSIVQSLDAAVQASPVLKGKVPRAVVAIPRLSMSDPHVQIGMRQYAEIIQSTGPKAQQLTVTLAPLPPLTSMPTQATVDSYLSSQLGRLNASSISQSSGDGNVDKLIAQLLASWQDQNTALYQGSFMLAVIEDALCAKQSGSMVIPGDRMIF